MSAGGSKARTQVSVPMAVYDELARLQQEWEAEHPGGTISLGAIIARLLAGQPVQP